MIKKIMYPIYHQSPAIRQLVGYWKVCMMVWILVSTLCHTSTASTFSFNPYLNILHPPAYGSQSCSIDLLSYAQPCPGDLECIQDYSADGYAFFLGFTNPADGTPIYNFAPETATFVTNADGTATLTAIIINKNDPNKQWNVEVLLEDAMTWQEWDALSNETSYYVDPTNQQYGVDIHYLNWIFYHLSNASTLTGVAGTYFDGAVLHLEHYHYNMYAFQVGVGANAHDYDYGGAVWMVFNGTRADGTLFSTGNPLMGDINFDFCNSICTGTATFSVNAQMPYSYNITPSALSNAVGNAIYVYDACPGTYTLTVVGADGCVATQTLVYDDPTTVNVYLPPVINTCNSSVSLSASVGFDSYLWSNGATTQNITVTQSGIYTVTVSQAGGCQGTAQSTVNVGSSNISVNLGPDVLTTCGPTTLNAGTGFSAYQWSTLLTTQSIFVANSGTYTVTVTDNNGCTATDQIVVNIGGGMQVNLGPNMQTFCGPTNIDAGAGFASYIWSTGQTTQSIYVTQPGDYSVTVTDPQGCQSIGYVWADIIYATVDLGAPNQTFCSGNILNAGTGFNNYNWSNGNTSQTITVTQSGTYTVTATDVHGCTATDMVNVTLNTGGISVDLGEDVVNICDDDSYTIFPSPSNFVGYQWSTGATSSYISVHQSDTYTLTVTAAGGCTATDQISINFGTGPYLNLGDVTQVACDSITLNLSQQNYDAYSWSTGATSPTIDVFVSGTYTVTATDAAGCSNSDVINIEIQNPVVDLGPDTLYTANAATVLDAQDYAEFTDYVWSTGASTPTLSVVQNGVYSVTASTPEGCYATDTVVVILGEGLASIEGRAFVDLNHNSLRENNEPTLPQIPVTLRRAISHEIVGQNYTNTEGWYVFDNIPLGRYYVTFKAPRLYTLEGSSESMKSANWDDNERGIGIQLNGNTRQDAAFITQSGLTLAQTNTANTPLMMSIPSFPTIYKCVAPAQPVTICLPPTDSEGNTITITEVNDAIGTITILSETCFRYTAQIGFLGLDTLSAVACNNDNECGNTTVIVSVGCPDQPDANADNATTFVAQPVAIDVVQNDGGFGALVASIASYPSNGIVEVDENNNIIYSPNLGFTGTDSLTYTVTDVFGQSNTASIIITVNPIAQECEQAQTACTQPYVSLLLCPSFCEPLSTWGTPTTTASIGGVFPTANTPNCYNFVVNDTAMLNETAEVVIQVCDVLNPAYCSTINYAIEISSNCDLDAIDDLATTAINTPVTINVIANDIDPQDDTFSVSDIYTAPQHGTANIVGNTIVYTPNNNYTGTDAFAYVVCDPYGHCDGASVTVTVGTPCETTLTVCAAPISPTEICVEFCTLVDYEITDINHSQMCSVAVISDTCFQYVALPQATGTDSLTVVGCNAAGQCETLLVLVHVECVAPQAVDDALTANIGEFSIINVAENDLQSCNFDYTTTLLTTPTLGEADFIVDGILYYEPAPTSGGQSETLTYEICNICDPTLCSTATVTVNIPVSVGNPPVAEIDIVITQQNQAVSIFPLTNDFGSNLSITQYTFAEHGTIVFNNSTNSFVYTPDNGYVGTDYFSYTICNPFGCDQTVIVISVEGEPQPNQSPIANDDTAEVTENQTVVINVLVNDSDPEGGQLYVTNVTTAQNGTVFINPNGTITYTPNTNFVGTDQFTYTVCDNGNPTACSTATVTVTVHNDGGNDNQAPIAIDDTVSTDLNTTLSINALANDSDPNNDPLTLSITDQANHGIASVNPDGSITYIPMVGFSGTDQLTYSICDNGTPPLCSSAIVTIIVNDTVTPPANLPPVAQNDTATVIQGETINIAVLNNDSDPNPDDNPLSQIGTLNIVELPTHGTVTINANHQMVFTANTGYVGTDQFVYTICDNGTPALCDEAIVYINITPANTDTPPVGVDDYLSTTEQESVSVNVLLNDLGTNLTLGSLIDDGNNGQVGLSNSTVTYTPNQGFVGQDTIVYTVCNSVGCDTALVIITVEAIVIDQVPIANADVATVVQDNTIDIAVLQNDIGNALNISAIFDQANNGQVEINFETLSYTPNPDFVGIDSFSYIVCNPFGCDTAWVVVTVTQLVETAPDALNDSTITNQDEAVTISVLSNDLGSNISITTTTQAANGTVVVNANGTITYTPDNGFSGTDFFDYTICNNLGCDSATVTVTVNEVVSGAAVAIDDAATTPQNTQIIIFVLNNDLGSNLELVTVGTASNGQTIQNQDGTVTYIPNTDFVGTDTFSYFVCNALGCDTAQVIVIVTPPNNNDVVAIDDFVNTDQGQSIDISVLSNDEGSNLQVISTSNSPNGTTIINNNGTITFTPNPDFTGIDVFSYIVCNADQSDCDTASVFVTVDLITNNENPVVNDNVANTNINTAVEIPVLQNDFDPDGGIVTLAEITELPSNGTAVITANGTILYTPNPDFVGTDTLTYSACDNDSPVLCDDAIVIITVTNDTVPVAPLAVIDTVYAFSGQSTIINVLINDIGNNIDVTNVMSAGNGTTQLNADGTVTYTPYPGFTNGTDYFDYTICNPDNQCSTTFVVVIMTQGEAPPNAQNDIANTQSGQEVTIPVLDNDTDPNPEDNPLSEIGTLSIATAPNHGTATITADNTISYTPNADFAGIDTLLYAICDNGTPALCDSALVIITVMGDTIPNQAPIANDDYVNGEANNGLTIIALQNDSDPDGDSIVVTTILTAPNHGTAVIDALGNIFYTPDSSFVGTDTLSYSVCDNGDPILCDSAMVYITITPDSINIAPIAQNDQATVVAGAFVTIPVLDNDFDPNIADNPLTLLGTVSILQNPQQGTVILSLNNSLLYQANATASGIDSIQYVVCDNGLPILCDTAWVIINIEADTIPEPIIVIANPNYVFATSGQLIDIDVLDNDLGDAIGITGIVTDASHGTVFFTPPQTTVSYISDSGFVGIDTFYYAICDTLGNCDTSFVVVNVTPDSLSCDIQLTSPSNTPVTICLADYINLPLALDTIVVYSNAENGTIFFDPSLSADSCINYQPNLDFLGPDHFSIGICDTSGLCDTIDICLFIIPEVISINAQNDTVNMTLGQTDTLINVLGNDTGEEPLTVIILQIPQHGTVELIGNDILYTPDSAYVGTDVFVYQITDASGNIDSALVFINIDSTNSSGNDTLIVALDDIDTTQAATEIIIPILANDTIPVIVGATTLVTILDLPSNGTATVTNDTTITYTPNPFFTGTDTFSYIVCVDNLCDTAQVVVVVEPNCDLPLFYPSGFSPNGDGKYETWQVFNLEACYPDNEVIIFNRWGDIVFRQDSYGDGLNEWNGKWQQNGNELPDGTYFYIVKLSPSNDKEVNGFIELKR